MKPRNILPRHCSPSHYRLSLRDLDCKAWTYTGTVAINLEITQATHDIVLNAKEIEVREARLESTDGSLATTTRPSYSYQTEHDTITLSFNEELQASRLCTLYIEFRGKLNSDAAGFYRVQYKAVSEPAASVARAENGSPYLLCTQFQPVDARRAFPCFDEPNIKATFSLDLELPDDQTAVSNTPVLLSEATSPGFKRVAFEKTPLMSTYLLAWTVGDFKYIETHTAREYNGKKIPVRLYAAAGLEEQGRFALEEAAKLVDFYSELFRIDYPLAKLDLVAIPDFSFGAMENWGLITGKTVLLLFDEKTGVASRKELIATIVAHEISHQWFGNLVTMDWWDELWLNEGFATWMGHHAVDNFHPEWKVWEKFLSQQMDSALGMDAMRSSHPIHAEVPDARNVHEVFDMISYQKSCAVLNMLATQFGTNNFLFGVSQYLQRNAYKNAKADDLWEALGEISGHDICNNIKPWIEKIGYPVLTIEVEENNLVLTQSRFLAAEDMKPEEDEVLWWIPLGFRGLGDYEGEEILPFLTEKQQRLPIKSKEALYLFNATGTGFYRVEYPPGHLAKLGAELNKLETVEQLTMIGSASALAFSGQGSTVALLEFFRAFSEVPNAQIWLRILRDLTRLRDRFDNDAELSTAIKRFIVDITAYLARKLGWEKCQGESNLHSKLRAGILTEAFFCDSTEVEAGAQEHSMATQGNPEELSVDPAVHFLVWGIEAKRSPKTAVPSLIERWQQSKSAETRQYFLKSMIMAPDEEVIKNELFPLCYGTEPEERVLKPSDMLYFAICLASSAVARPLQWEYIKENWDAFAAKMGPPDRIGRILTAALPRFSDNAMIEDIDRFFADKNTTGYAKALEKAKDAIGSVSRYCKREREPLAAWLKEQGYMESRQ